MAKLGRALGLVSVLVLGMPSAGYAVTRDFGTVCNTGSFITCASVQIVISGTSVTLKIKNMSAGTATNSANGYRNSVFYEIGMRNVPSGKTMTMAPSTSGPSWLGGTAPTSTSWVATDNNTTTDDALTFRNAATGSPTRNNGIASNCDTATYPAGTRLWMSATCGTTDVRNPGTNSGYTNLTFMVNSTWDPTTTEIIVKAIDESGNLYELNTTGMVITPEPASVLLLLTGLAGLGGAQRMRRRRNELV